MPPDVYFSEDDIEDFKFHLFFLLLRVRDKERTKSFPFKNARFRAYYSFAVFVTAV